MILLIIIYSALTACGFGFRYYRWWDVTNPDATWIAHALQWWWSYGAIIACNMLRFVLTDTVWALIGQCFACIGAAAVGYVIGHAWITEKIKRGEKDDML